MTATDFSLPRRNTPSLATIAELLKPITWFAPMWAFGCGVVASGVSLSDRWLFLVGGVVLAGPCVCAASQAVNDWFDRHVDAINEPNRPIPSGRMPGRWGLYVAIAWTLISLALGALLGAWAFGATLVGLALAWGYSAPPFRFKMNGWLGAAAVGFSYEGVAWFTGAAVMLGALPGPWIIAFAVLYSIGAHGIMTLNDFKAIEGDAEMGIKSLPVTLGPGLAAVVACALMILPQYVVVGLLMYLGTPIYALAVGALVLGQIIFMKKLLSDPRKFAPWYNASGVSLYVLGMLVSAFALRTIGGAA